MRVEIVDEMQKALLLLLQDIFPRQECF